MNSGDHHDDVPDNSLGPGDGADEQLDPTAPHPLARPQAEDEQPDQDDAAPEDIPVAGVEFLRWAPDLTAEVPARSDLADEPPADDPPGGAPTAALPLDQASLLGPPDPSEVPTDPTASVFAAGAPPSAPSGPPPGPPGPPAPPHPRLQPPPEKADRPQIGPVILGLIGLGGLLLVALALVALQGRGDGGDGSDADTDAEVSQGTVDDLGEDSSLIVGPTGVVGTWSGSGWEPRAEGAQPGAGIELLVVGLGEVVATEVGEAGQPVAGSCAADAADQDVRVTLDPDRPGAPPPVAVAGVDDPLPRPIEHFESSETYRDAAAEVAQGEGATTPPTVTQVLRMDLDGTGTDEVVVAAEHLSDPEGLTPSPGDWSLVFLRRVIGDDVATDLLASSVANGDGGPLERIQVSAVADLNGDGVMEVVLSGQSASSDWTAIHAADGDGVAGGLPEVLRAACGE